MTELEQRALNSSRIAIAAIEQDAIELQIRASQTYEAALQKLAELSVLKAAVDAWEQSNSVN